MAARKDYDGMTLDERDGAQVMALGRMEIWDGADLALLRDSLNDLVRSHREKSIGVDMSHVKYVPSGFFGMLFEAYELGVEIKLYGPQPRVRNMLWFRKFFEFESPGVFRLEGAEEITRSAPVKPRRKSEANEVAVG